jgi:hypothetical protein
LHEVVGSDADGDVGVVEVLAQRADAAKAEERVSGHLSHVLVMHSHQPVTLRLRQKLVEQEHSSTVKKD